MAISKDIKDITEKDITPTIYGHQFFWKCPKTLIYTKHETSYRAVNPVGGFLTDLEML